MCIDNIARRFERRDTFSAGWPDEICCWLAIGESAIDQCRAAPGHALHPHPMRSRLAGGYEPEWCAP
jgi:hypothetical protein